MERGQTDRSQSDHGSVKDKEFGLVVPDVTPEAFPQLGHSVCRSDQDEDGCHNDRNHEDFEDWTIAYSLLLMVHVQYASLAAQGKVGYHEQKDG